MHINEINFKTKSATAILTNRSKQVNKKLKMF